MENPFKDLLNRILPEEKEETFDPKKVPLEMYEISGQDKITEHSFNRYIGDRSQDEVINKKIHIKLFLTQKDVLLMSKEDQSTLILMCMFSSDKQEQDLGQGILLRLNEKKRIELIPYIVNYAMNMINSFNPEVQLAASKNLILNMGRVQMIMGDKSSLFELITSKAQKLIEASNLSETKKLFGISDSRAWRIALEMTEYLPNSFNNLIHAVHISKSGVAVEAAKFIINSVVLDYRLEDGTEGPLPFLISEALKSDDIIVTKGIAKKIRLLRLDEEGRTVIRQLYNMPKNPDIHNYPIIDIVKKNVLSAEHLYELRERIIKESHFDKEGKKIIQRIIHKIHRALSDQDFGVVELAAEAAGLLLDDIKSDEIIISMNGGVTDEKVITDKERSELQEAILFKVNKGLGKSNFALKTNKELTKPNIEIQKSAARMVRYIPEKEIRKYILELFDDSNQKIRKIATELISSVPREEKENLFQIAIDKGLTKELIESPLYDKYDINKDEFSRELFDKTGSKTILIGGPLMGKTIIRNMTPRTFLSWKKLFEDYELWKRNKFDYVPIEPIQSYRLNKEGMVEVYSGVLDLNLEQWFSKTSKFKTEIENQEEKIKEALKEVGIVHGHAHIRNFCLRFFRDKNGNPDLNIAPRVYLIDFDKAIL